MYYQFPPHPIYDAQYKAIISFLCAESWGEVRTQGYEPCGRHYQEACHVIGLTQNCLYWSHVVMSRNFEEVAASHVFNQTLLLPAMAISAQKPHLLELTQQHNHKPIHVATKALCVDSLPSELFSLQGNDVQMRSHHSSSSPTSMYGGCCLCGVVEWRLYANSNHHIWFMWSPV